MTERVASTIPGADDAARRAAEAAGVEVMVLDSVADLRVVAELFDGVWGTEPARTPMPVELLRALAHAGCYVAGAVRDGRLVGASAAFFAGPDGSGHQGTELHSHVTGVERSARGRGVGLALKQHQRAWALARGVHVVSWTFDPLVRRNAWFNLARLGAVGVDFRPCFYGPMDDAVNAGDESDRLVVAWRLADDLVARAAANGSAPLVEPPGAATVLEDDGGRPRARPSAAPVRIAHLPADIEALRRADPATAQAWRLALRHVLRPAFDDGLRAIGMTPGGAYVLAREETW